MIVVAALVALGGIALMVVGSQRAVDAATALAASSRLPPFFVGMTLLAIGTDLPEIANSIVASATGHGDVNVGDSVGSAATQATLVLGLLPIVGGAIVIPKRGVFVTGVATTVSLVVLALLISDGVLGRVDAAVLLVLWGAGTWLVLDETSYEQQLPMMTEDVRRRELVARTIAALAVVAGGAITALWGIVEIAERAGLPEFLVGFFLASIGTSLPELVFNITAIRRGEAALAVGDLVGASFLDATLSVAIGPLLFPTAITVSEVRPGVWWAAATLAVVTLMISRIRVHDWRTGVILLCMYAGLFVALW
jgi:cation:H+ antiporter